MIHLMRHGKDDERYVGGWSNLSILDDGKKKIEDNALWIKKNLNIKKIISSDIKRAVETSKIVSDILGLKVTKTSLLREQNKGLLNGKLKESLSLEEKNLVVNQEIDTIFPEGESLIDLYERVQNNMSYFEEIDDDTLIITHRGVINMFYYIFNDINLDMDKKKFDVTHGSIHEIDFKNKKIRRIK
jgi:probable phosphoglycerate mutase